MFEYLMPMLVMPSYPDTLLEQMCRTAVNRHIEYGKQRNVPWEFLNLDFMQWIPITIICIAHLVCLSGIETRSC